MFELEDLLADLSKHNTPPTRKPANPQENTSRTTKEVAGSEPATHPQVPATYPQTPATLTPFAGDLRVMRVDAGKQPAHENAVQDEENPNLAGLRVEGVFVEQKPTPDPDPSGCPTHWQRVPELPPRGSKVAMVDEAGLGNLYRFKVKGVWYLLKFLPPFDGRVSLTDQQGRVRVLASLDEAAGFLALVTKYGEDVLEPTPPEGGEFSKPISRFSTTLAESRSEDFSSPGQGKPEEFSRLATLADSRIQQPTLPSDWENLLEQVEPLAAQLVELQAPVLRLDVERIARGYQSIEGMDFEEVAKLLRRMIEVVAREYPEADNIHVIAQWPGRWPEKTRNKVLWSVVTL